MENTIQISVLPNGPLMVEGTIKIQKVDGTIEVIEEQSFLCRCGHSSNKPYCDGTHKKNNFIG